MAVAGDAEEDRIVSSRLHFSPVRRQEKNTHKIKAGFIYSFDLHGLLCVINKLQRCGFEIDQRVPLRGVKTRCVKVCQVSLLLLFFGGGKRLCRPLLRQVGESDLQGLSATSEIVDC